MLSTPFCLCLSFGTRDTGGIVKNTNYGSCDSQGQRVFKWRARVATSKKYGFRIMPSWIGGWRLETQG